MSSPEKKNLIKELAKIKLYNEWLNNPSSENRFIISEAPISINYVDDIGKKLKNIVKGLQADNLQKVIDDLGYYQSRITDPSALRRSFTSLPEAQLITAVKSLINQNIPEVNQFVTEVISQKLGISLDDLKLFFDEDFLQANPTETLQKNIEDFLTYTEIDKLDAEFQDAVRSYFTKIYSPARKNILTQNQIKELSKAVNKKGGVSFISDVLRAIFKSSETLISDIKNLIEEFGDKVVLAEGDEQRKQLQEAYALQISRKLNQIYMKGNEVAKQEFRKLDLPQDIKVLIDKGDQDIFKIFRQLRAEDPSISSAFKSMPEDFQLLDTSGEPSKWLGKFLPEKIANISKIRLGENLKAFLISGQWSTKADIYRKAIQMQGIKDPKRAAQYLFVLLIKSGLGAIFANSILSFASALSYTSGLKDVINDLFVELGKQPPFDTKKYTEERKKDPFGGIQILDAFIVDFFGNTQGLSFAVPYWNTMAKAPINVMLGTLLTQKPSLWGGPDKWAEILWKSAAKAASIPEEDIEKIEKDTKKIEKDQFVIPEDLKLTLSGDLQFLQDRVYRQNNDTLAIAFEKGRESNKDVQLVNPDGNWKVVHFTDSSQTNQTSSPLSDTDVRKYLKTYFGAPVNESYRKNKISEQLIIPPKKEEKSAGENLDQKVEELEKDIESIKDSKTAQRAKEKWNKLLNDAKNAGAAAATELEILRLRQKIDAAEKKATAGSSTENFIDCTGWNKVGCKSESIRKVQTCFNLGVSGNFDKNLSNELAKYATTFAYKDGFNDSDVDKICRFKNEEDKKVMLQQQKQAELDRFRRQYPQQTTKATTIDEF
jgi:hypothetical protein